jgi:translocation and assembly module TamB
MQWRRTVRWTVASFGILIFAVAGCGYLYLKSRSFQEYALRTIVQRANDATGGRTEIGNLDFQLSTLTAHLYKIILHGTGPAERHPLLQVDKITVGLKIQSVLHHKVILSELLIDHPVVHLEVDRDGKNNIPSAPSQNSSSNTNVFDLAVRHVLLTAGEINYQDKKTPIDADLYDLDTDIHFDPLMNRYAGSMSYGKGHLRYAQYSPLPHSLNAKFTANPSRFSLDSALLNIGSSAVSLRADVADYNNPNADGSYEIRIHAQDFASMSPDVSPSGDLILSGKIHYQNAANQPLLRCVSIDGQLASDALAASSSQGRLDLRKLQGRYELRNATLHARNVAADVLGGRVTTDVDIEHLDTTAVSRIRTYFRGISLQAAGRAARRPELQRVNLVGTLDGTTDAAWTGSISNLRAHTDLNLRSAVSGTATRSSNAVPIDGSIHGSYDGAKNIIAFRDTTVRMPSTTVTVQGEISNRSNLQVQANANDLHQLEVLASALRGESSTQISGSATLNAVVRGSIHQPQIAGQLNAQNLQIQGSGWSSAKTEFRADPSQISLQNGSLVNAHQGKASFSAGVQLHDWSYIPSNPITMRLSAQQMSVADLQRLANVQYPVSGDLSADISLHGSQLDPHGTGSARIANARAYDEPVQNLAVKFSADKGSVTSTLDVSLPAGSANASLSYTPKTKQYKVRLNVPSVVLQNLHAVQAKNLPLTGTLTATADGEGTVDNPQLTAVLQLPQVQLRQNSISNLKAELRVADQHADLALNSQVAQSSIQAHGRVNLTGDYYTEAAVDTTSVPIDVLLAAYIPSLPQDLKGQTEFHATIKGPVKDKSQLEAHLTIPTLHASYQSLEIGAASPIRADYLHSVVTIQPAEIRGTGTSLRVQGSIPLAGTAKPNLAAQGSVDVRVLRIVQPDMHSSGILSLDVRASGSAQSPSVEGQMRLQDVALSTPSAPLGVEKVNGTLDISKDRLQISSLTGQVGGGQVSMGGSITYQPALQFNVALHSQSVRLRYPDGLRAVLDGNLVFLGTKEASTLNGRVLIDSLAFTPDFDLAKFGEQFSGNTVPAQPGFADTIKLAIQVQSSDNLSATSSEVSLEGRANLRITGTAANPVITGRTDLTAGELFYRNVRYQLQRGIITFEDPNETKPVMNVSVATTVEQYNLTLTLRGPLDKLTTSYVSDPPLATADIINLIARGKTTQESSAASQSTDSMIASQAASQFSSSVQKLAGISSLQIDPLIGVNNQNPSARVAIQQRVTNNFLFTFSTDVSQPGSEMVQGDYKINKRWSVSVARDQVGGVSVDGKFHTKF